MRTKLSTRHLIFGQFLSVYPHTNRVISFLCFLLLDFKFLRKEALFELLSFRSPPRDISEACAQVARVNETNCASDCLKSFPTLIPTYVFAHHTDNHSPQQHMLRYAYLHANTHTSTNYICMFSSAGDHVAAMEYETPTPGEDQAPQFTTTSGRNREKQLATDSSLDTSRCIASIPSGRPAR